MDIDSKLPGVGTSIFTTMSQLAADHDAINLSQGFPSFEPPAALIDRIQFHLLNGANQYAPMPGVPALRTAIADKTRKLQNRVVDPDSEVTVCCGATEGLFSAIQAVVRRDDEVIVFDPAYDAYEPVVSLAGGTTRHIPLAIDPQTGEFQLDRDRLRETISGKTRLVILNFPHNPTGAILSSQELDELADIVRDTNTFLLSDEVYEHIVFDGEQHRSVLSHDELWERSLVISSFGKTVHATGWKVGYCIAPANLSTEFRRVHQFSTFSVVTPIQNALADFMESHAEFALSVADFYQQKRDHFCALLKDSAFRFQPARSTFFQLLDYGEISDEPDTDIAKRWTEQFGVASIPVSVFCDAATDRNYLRFCFAKDDDTLALAVERLRNV